MAVYTVAAPDGKTYKVEGPEGATAEDLGAFITKQNTTVKPYDIPAGVKSAMNIGQAMTFGFGDEIAGAMGADKDRYRTTLKGFQDEYPGSAMLGSVAGSMLLPFGAGKLAIANPWTTTAAVGGLAGMAQGAGDAPDMASVPQGMSTNGMLGAAAGPMLLGMAKPVGSVMSALGTKLPLVGDALTDRLSRNRVAEAFSRDSTDAQAVGRNMIQLGPEARIADGAGESTRNLLDLNANLPGKTATTLEDTIRNRIVTRPDRLDNAVYAVSPHGRAGDMVKALTEQQRKVAGPLYQQVQNMDVAPSSQLINDLEAAKKLGAFGEAEKMALADPSFGPFTLGASQQSLGGGRVGVKDLDHVKRGLDSLIDAQTDAVTGKVTPLGRSYVVLKRRLVDEIDALTTDPQTGKSVYKAARDAYAGPAALKSAIDKGRSFFGEKAPRLQDLLDGMSAGEQDAFRVGAAEALREKVGSQTGQNQLLNIWKDRNVREKLKALLGDDVKYSQVESMLKNEGILKRMEGLGPSRNSRTFSREAGAEDQTAAVVGDMLSMGVAAKTGGLPQILGGLGKVTSRIGTPEPVRDGIGKILLQQYSPAELNALFEAQKVIQRQRAVAAAGAGVAGGKAAGPVGGLLD